MDFKAKLKEYTALVERELERVTEFEDLPQKKVMEAMKYSLLSGGKRIRPVITIAVADMFGGNINDAAAVGCALECVHTYSLIHDDLPCMDDDDLRRGRPTCHKVYGEDIAVLAGDGLLNYAFELLSDPDLFEELNGFDLLRAVRTLSTASGVFGMVGGQTVDLACEGGDGVGIDELEYMHSLKTGALINAAAELGCIVGHIDEDDTRILSKIYDFSSKLGLAFQIKDDILDVVGDQEVLGKATGSDASNGKTTFVTLLGFEKSSERLMGLTAEAKAALAEFGDSAEFLTELADYLLERDK